MIYSPRGFPNMHTANYCVQLNLPCNSTNTHPPPPSPSLISSVNVSGGGWQKQIFPSLLPFVDNWLCHWQEKNISIQVESLHQSGQAPSEPSETPNWWISPLPASITHIVLHIALGSEFHCFFSLFQFRNLNEHSGIAANCSHLPEWVHWVHAGIRIALWWVMLWKYLLAFLSPVHKAQFSDH